MVLMCAVQLVRNRSCHGFRLLHPPAAADQAGKPVADRKGLPPEPPNITVRTNRSAACREGEFRFYFFSREESRMHVHVSHPDGEAKFWLTPSIELACNIGLSATKLGQTVRLVQFGR